ncbi:MAG: hypothetical protein ISS15_07730 [Alphaproteobacteria bacterium]|nr:hypothetical protein [Alphaproteobacteria bacterium]MBL6936761.1 hypothetical protein [Alphaproteobacteria bacterium]MBL7097530.1 hypothetical protein [Alphaproteobacteria bacterium]
MRNVLIAASALAFIASPALADDVMAGYYGNTVVVSGGMVESHTHYRGDKTFDVTASAMGMDYKFGGTWEIKGDQICRTFVGSQPPNITNPNCSPLSALASHKVGETWNITTPKGESRTLSLKAGVQ